MSEPAYRMDSPTAMPPVIANIRGANLSGASAIPTRALPPLAHAECLCAEELAIFLGVNRKTVYEYAARNVIPHQRLGRRIVFSRPQVVAWLGACKASPTGKAI